jgi:lantibiotic modifying enzyme
LTKDETYLAEAQAAIRTTRRAIEAASQGTGVDFSLCHGIAGNTELLIFAGQILGDHEDHSAAAELGRRAIERNLQPRLPWPCGVPGGGEAPGLMLGLAGIGYFFLRLDDPSATPSIQIILP